jgi:tRNA-splicing ligase RtcB
MSRKEAKRRFTLADHERVAAGVECRTDSGVIDETPMAYKNIDAAMAAQADLVCIPFLGRKIYNNAAQWSAR